MSFVDTSSDPFFAPFNFIMDYDGLLPSSRGPTISSTKTSQPWPEQHHMPQSWSMQKDFSPNGAPSNHPMNNPLTRFQNQNMPAPDPVLFPESSPETVDFVGFWHNQNPSMFTPRASSHVNSMDYQTSPTMPPVSGGHRTIPGTPDSTHQQQTTNSNIHPSPPIVAQTNCQNNPQNCLSSALEILHTLHIPPSGCLSSLDSTSTPSANNRHPRKTDAVLATNRTAIHRISQICECSCVASSQLEFILVIICDKLIAWYRAILHSLPQDPSAMDEDPSSTASEPPERVLHQRFAVGSCSFDQGLESRMLAQVVSSELQQLESVIRDFDRRLREDGARGVECTSQQQQRGVRVEAKGLLGPVRMRLTAHLLKKVEELKGEVSRGLYQ
ncbi:hypothetical protein XPA_002428 [Xanthoria parietina]